MAQEFKLPDLGEGIESGDVVQVLVKEGDVIQPQQAVMEIETDKAVLEVPCPIGGKVTKVHIQQGQKAKVGSTILTIEGDGQAGAAPAAASGTVKEPAGKAQAQKEEDQRDTSKAGEVAEAVGDKKPKPAPARRPPGRKEVAAQKEPAPEPEEPAESPEDRTLRGAPAAPPKAAAPPTSHEPIAAGPATRRLARELGVDLKAVADTRPGGRLTEDDVKAYVRGEMGATREAVEGGPPVKEPPLPDFSQWGTVERAPLSSLNRKSAEHVAMAWSVAPHVTQFDEADITALEVLRKRYRERGPGSEVKLTVTAFVLKAVTVALKMQPTFNASIDMAAGEIVLKKYYSIGVAVDTDAGLIVPVIRDVDQKRVLEIAGELEDVAERTRKRKIKLEELQGGTFTVTNLGGIGGTAFTPIINHPEVAILGLARSRQVPILRDGQLAEKTVLPLCLSYDHRVVNGADGARFLRKVASLLEDPEMLLLEG